MSKPWEETWHAGIGGIYHDHEGEAGRALMHRYGASNEQLLLAARAPEMARMLLSVEFVLGESGEGTTGFFSCGSCGFEKSLGHSADCALDALLRKVGVRV